MKTNTEVEKIIQYLEDKLAQIRGKIEKYETPILGEVLKNSSHIQSEYFRLCARADEIEDNLLAIKRFSGVTPKKKNNGNSKGEKED